MQLDADIQMKRAQAALGLILGSVGFDSLIKSEVHKLLHEDHAISYALRTIGVVMPEVMRTFNVTSFLDIPTPESPVFKNVVELEAALEDLSSRIYDAFYPIFLDFYTTHKSSIYNHIFWTRGTSEPIHKLFNLVLMIAHSRGLRGGATRSRQYVAEFLRKVCVLFDADLCGGGGFPSVAIAYYLTMFDTNYKHFSKRGLVEGHKESMTIVLLEIAKPEMGEAREYEGN